MVNYTINVCPAVACVHTYSLTLLFPDMRTCSPWLFDRYHSDGLGRPEKKEVRNGGTT